MTALWKSEDVAEATRGYSEKKWVASGIAIDSRKVKKGDLFFAMPGTRYDGHNFLDNAFQKGAVASLVSDKKLINKKGSYLFVSDVPRALNDLALAARKRSRAKVIAITGSVGKTGTKEMLRLALSVCGKVHASEESLNNHVGVPLSLSRLPKDADYSILELGMNHKGEIEKLSKLVCPDIAIITSIEIAHIKFFDSILEIAKAKSEIFLGLKKSGAAIINKDSEGYDLLNLVLKENDIKNIITFGINQGADIRLIDQNVIENSSIIKAIFKNKVLEWEMPIRGEHWVKNSLIVLAVTKILNENPEHVLKGLLNFKVPEGRGNIHKISFEFGNIVLINDSYNANPASMISGIKKLCLISKIGRKVAVLGDMKELGEMSYYYHKKIADTLLKSEIDLVFTIGDLMKDLFLSLPEKIRGLHNEDVNNLFINLFSKLRANDTILIKGSNSMSMQSIVKKIIERGNKIDDL